MKKYSYLSLFALFAISCTTTETVVVVDAAPTSYMVDDYYILMSDAYHLRPGMTYQEVKSVLKQDPYEIHQNIQDNCIVLSYNLKRNARIHKDTQQPVPMEFYKSSDDYNLTYQKADTFYLILDSSNKKLRTFFTSPNKQDIERYSMLLRRAKNVCNDPRIADDYMSLWAADSNPKGEATEVSVRGFLGK